MLIPVGFRFEPTDKEIIVDYLRKKVYGEPFWLPPNTIVERDVYGKEEPSVLFNGSWENTLYFFTLVKDKHDNGNGKKKSRTVGATGTWKIQSSATKIFQSQSTLLGFKSSLTFTSTNQDGHVASKNRTRWTMHEYTLASYPPQQHQNNSNRWAICRITKHDPKGQLEEASTSHTRIQLQELETTMAPFTFYIPDEFISTDEIFNSIPSVPSSLSPSMISPIQPQTTAPFHSILPISSSAPTSNTDIIRVQELETSTPPSSALPFYPPTEFPSSIDDELYDSSAPSSTTISPIPPQPFHSILPQPQPQPSAPSPIRIIRRKIHDRHHPY